MTTADFPADSAATASTTTAPEAITERITGYDLARALAILGMVLVHFTLVMSFKHLNDGWLSRIVGFLDGRAAATFVVLAGVGLTLRSRPAAAADNDAALWRVRSTVIKRGLFLLVAGYVNLLIWSGDILRVYGVSLLLAAWFIRAPGRTLWAVSLLFVAGFLALFASFDYSRNWDWGTLEYRGLWTAAGALRNLFYDGFRSVFPWTGLLFFGMWLGRQDLRRPDAAARFLLAGVLVVVLAELLSCAILWCVLSPSIPMDREEAFFLFGTGSMPPLPLFLVSAVGTAVAAIAASVMIADRFPSALTVRALVATGQLAFTWYVAHIILGLGTLIALGLTDDRPLWLGLAAGAGFFLLATVISFPWRRHFRHGPLEWVMRRVAG